MADDVFFVSSVCCTFRNQSSTRVATNHNKDDCCNLRLQVILTRVLQLAWHSATALYGTFKSSLRACCNPLGTDKPQGWIALQVILTRVLQRQNCTKMTHARITMCILTFSSVLPAQRTASYGHFLDFRAGSRPKIRCEPATSVAFTSGSHRWFPV